MSGSLLQPGQTLLRQGQSHMSEGDETLFEFPCTFPIKAMGRTGGDFPSLVLGIVRRHVPNLDESRVSLRHSRSGRWVSDTVTIEAESRDQLDAIYLELSANEYVVWAL